MSESQTPAAPATVKSRPWAFEKESDFLSITEIRAALRSFSGILPPVFFTMLLSAVVVLYVTPNVSDVFAESQILLFNEGTATSNAQAAGFGLVNALIIIAVVVAMTFLIVCLIYFKCELFFAIYLFCAMVLLMGFTTGVMVVEGLRFYLVPTDIITLAIVFYNFAIVGAISIFSYEVGFQGKERLIPLWVTQCYLVIISVVMAWLVTSIFPDFTVWALLVCLALYDLCAVLTPCGPLKLLIQVVTRRSEENERRAREQGVEDNGNQRQMIPGLLYEVNTGKSKGMKRFQQNNTTSNDNRNENQKKPGNTMQEVERTEAETQQTPPTSPKTNQKMGAGAAGLLNFSVLAGVDPQTSQELVEIEAEEREIIEAEATAESQSDSMPTAEPVTQVSSNTSAPVAQERVTWIEMTKDERLKYLTELERRRERLEERIEAEYEDSNLKLGLGDFVFYSVLTAKSAEFGFLAFITVAICVLCGLCGTLVLLSVFQKALPALPISIALGVMTYVVAFLFLSPFSDGLALNLATV